MVHVARIDIGVCGGDPVRLAPQRFVMEKPGALLFRQVFPLRTIGAHEQV
jgi:hypothetical protein